MKTKIYIVHNNPVIREICEVKADENEKALSHFIPPFGVPELLFYVGNRKQVKNVSVQDGLVKGQYDLPQKIDFNPGYHFITVRLHPFGTWQLFGTPANQLVNSVLDATDHELTAHLAELVKSKKEVSAGLLNEMVNVITTFPRKKVSVSTLQFFERLAHHPSHKINEIIEDSGIELRTLQRNFTKEVGLTPKKFLRIIRMRQVEEKFQQKQDWFEIISDFDFTDQSHLAKEFKLLLKNTPTDFKNKKLFLSDQLPAPEMTDLE